MRAIAFVGLAACAAELDHKTPIIPEPTPVPVVPFRYTPLTCTETATIDTPGYDGGVDLTFDATGRVVIGGRGGKINKEGGSALLAARAFPDGKLDTTFGGTGYVLIDIDGVSTVPEGVAVDSAGRILVVGAAWPGNNQVALARLLADGKLDTTFGTNGKIRGPEGNPMAVMVMKSRVVVAGYGVVASFDDNGALGTAPRPHKPPILVDDAAAMRDGGIVLTGREWKDTWTFAIARLDDKGVTDTHFGREGIVTCDTRSANTVGQAIRVNSDGRIIAAGYTKTELAICALKPDGTLDTSFGKTGIVIGGTGMAQDFAFDAAGGIAIVQSHPVKLVRYAHDGTFVDTTDLPMGYAQAVAIAQDGTVWVTGETVKRETLSLVACRP